jgi:hypothetical protein
MIKPQKNLMHKPLNNNPLRLLRWNSSYDELLTELYSLCTECAPNVHQNNEKDCPLRSNGPGAGDE